MGEVKEVSVGDIGARAANADPELKAETMALNVGPSHPSITEIAINDATRW